MGTLDPQTLDPQILDPHSVRFQIRNRWLGILEPQSLDPQTLDPKTLDPQTLDPQTGMCDLRSEIRR